MRRTGRLIVAVATVFAGVAATPAGDELAWTATPGGWVSGPVEYVTTIAEEVGGASDAVVHDGRLYVSSFRSFSIYDVSDPTDPAHLHTEPLVTGTLNEMPQTNGEILLLSRDAGTGVPRVDGVPNLGSRQLDIWDVTDPTDPELLASYPARPGVWDHTWACLADCAYAYSAAGTILDLRDPSTPTFVGDWSEIAPYDAVHSIQEVAPGIVVTGTLPVHVLDARQDPARPTLLASFDPTVTVPEPSLNPSSLVARAAWPNALDNGRVAILSMETPFTNACTEDSGDVQTFTVRGSTNGNLRFEPADRWHIDPDADRTAPPQGTWTDGAPPYNVAGCGAYGLATRPDFGTHGGTAAVAFFEHGVRLLDVDRHGQVSLRGGFLPVAGNSTAPKWVTDDVVYVVDLQRGVDVLRITDG